MTPPLPRRLALALLLGLALVAGAAADPFEVATYADLCKVGTGTDGWTLDADYVQTADIQCPAGANFTPIGNSSVWFTGSYDGLGYKIRDLSMYYPLSSYIGMFTGIDYGAVIKNVVLDNVSVTAGECSGGLFGEVDCARVENCTVSGSIDCIYKYDPHNHHRALLGLLGGYAYECEILNCSVNGEIRGSEPLCVRYAGGLVGWAEICNISSCTTTGTVLYASSFVGGLVGSSYGNNISSCSADVEIRGYSDADADVRMWGVGGLVGEAYDTTISACSASGDINYADDACGGLIGEAIGVTLTDCHATGDVRTNLGYSYSFSANGGFGGTVKRCIIDTCSAEGTVSGGDGGTGGFIGDCTQTTVTKCYATGSVEGFGFVGGLIGNYDPSEGVIEDSYATGSVVCRGVESYCSAGGLIGAWDQHSLISGEYVKNSYSSGRVEVSNLPPEAAGGAIGKVFNPGVGAIATYWDTETSGQAASAGGAVGKTTAEMKTIATFAGWNIATPAEYTDEVWFIVEGEDYPRLAWQGLPAPEEPTPTATSGTLPGPLPVRFVVQSYTGQPLANITVTATPLESTGPWSWLYDLFGISGDADLTGTVLAGTTDSGGGIVFSLIQTVKYRVTVTDASRGIDTSITLYPQEDAVVISVWPEEGRSPAGDFSLYAEEEAGGTRVGVRYAAAGVTRVTFTVKDEAGAVLYTRTSAAPEDDLSYLLDGEPGEVFTYGYAGEHPEYGRVQKDQFIRFEGEARPLIDLAPWIPLSVYHWASIFLIVGFAMTFVRGEIRGALLTIPIIAGILWLIGWFQVPWLVIGGVLVLGILIYARMGESDLGI